MEWKLLLLSKHEAMYRLYMSSYVAFWSDINDYKSLFSFWIAILLSSLSWTMSLLYVIHSELTNLFILLSSSCFLSSATEQGSVPVKQQLSGLLCRCCLGHGALCQLVRAETSELGLLKETNSCLSKLQEAFLAPIGIPTIMIPF